jgi:hypothetical protein
VRVAVGKEFAQYWGWPESSMTSVPPQCAHRCSLVPHITPEEAQEEAREAAGAGAAGAGAAAAGTMGIGSIGSIGSQQPEYLLYPAFMGDHTGRGLEGIPGPGPEYPQLLLVCQEPWCHHWIHQTHPKVDALSVL